MSAMNNKTGGIKELLTFASFICLIFSFLIVSELQATEDLFLRIVDIILLIVLGASGIISAIKSTIDSSLLGSKFLIIMNLCVLLTYLVLIIKVVYIFRG